MSRPPLATREIYRDLEVVEYAVAALKALEASMRERSAGASIDGGPGRAAAWSHAADIVSEAYEYIERAAMIDTEQSDRASERERRLDHYQQAVCDLTDYVINLAGAVKDIAAPGSPPHARAESVEAALARGKAAP